jgi:thymidine phosphorylase
MKRTEYQFDGHINKDIINNVLNDQYLTAMCVEDYLSSMSQEELDDWIKNFINTGAIKK